MPLIDEPSASGFVTNPMLPGEQARLAKTEAVTPAFMEVAGAEFQTNNPPASIIADESGLTSRYALQAYDPDLDIGAELKGTRWENDPALFVTARNRDHIQAIQRDLEREERNRDILERSTWGQYIPAFIAGQVADPINWLSLGTVGAIKFAGKGVTALGRAGTIGVGAAVDTAAQEALLQASQRTRTAAESVVAIGGSMALGSLIGWAGSKLLLPAERATLERAIETDLGEPTPRPVGLSRASDVGAAATRTDTEFAAPELEGSFGAGWLSSRMGPLQRTSRSELESTRRVVGELAESPYVYKGNEDFVPVAPRGDALGRPGAVRTRIESIWASDMMPSLEAMRSEYLAYRGVHAASWAERAKMGLNDRLGRNGEALSEIEFREAVTDAVFGADTSGLPQVAALAKKIQGEIVDKVTKEAKAAGLMDETDNGGLPRSYLMDKVRAKQPEFRQIVIEHLTARRAEKIAELDALEKTQAAERAAKEVVTDDVRDAREMSGLRDQAERDAARETPIRYDGLPVTDEEIDSIVGFWSYVREMESKPKPESLTSFIVRSGGLQDPNGDVVSLLGRAKDRPGLIRKSGDGGPNMLGASDDPANSLDNVALRAWEQGFFPDHVERPTINDLLDRLADDLQDGNVTRADDAGYFDDLAVARDMEQELAEYGIRPRQFNKESRLREYFGQKVARTADEDAGAAGSAKGGKVEADGPPLTKAEEALRIRANMEDGELMDLADRLIERMGGVGEGRFHSTRDMLRNADGDVNEKALLDKGDFDLPYSKVKDFMQRDMEILLRMMLRSEIPDIEIALRFGDPEMKAAKQQIIEEATNRMNAAASPKERAKIEKQRDRDLIDIDGMRDRIAGRYGLPTDPTSIAVRAGRFARDAATITKMGASPLASIPETARLITARGLSAVFSDLFGGMMTNWTKFASTASEAKMMTHAMEHWTSSRALAFADNAEDWGSTPKVDRFSREATKTFMRMTGLPMLTDWQKSASGVLVMRNLLEASEAVKLGTATPKQVRDLARLGIGRENATAIADQFAKHGSKDDRIWAAETGKWDAEARAPREAFMTAMRRETNRIITTPGDEIPLMMSTEAGRFFGQFKSFAIGSYERVLVSGLQHNDARFWASAVVAIGLAMATNEARKALFGSNDGKRQKSWSERWNDPKERNQIWLDAVDKSGILGWMPEINQTMDRALGMGLSSGFGVVNRRPGVGKTEDAIKQFAGPGASTVGDLTFAGTKAALSLAGKHRWTEADTNQMQRVIPYIGLSYIRGGLEALGAEEAINKAIGARKSGR